MSRYILDTNIFNRALDGQVDLGNLKEAVSLFATHIELNELQKTKNAERRAQLLEVFRSANPEPIATESAVWGISEWGNAKWTAENNLYEPILEGLNTRNGGKTNNTQDALIAETAIRNELTLVTEDRDLAAIAAEHGATVIDLARFLKECSEDGLTS